MVQSVELLLDPHLDAQVRAQWAALLAAGVDSQGRIRSETNRPHVTLFVAGSIPADLDAAVRDACFDSVRDACFESVPVTLGGLVVFGGRHATLARLVVPSTALLAVHARVFGALGQCPGIPEHIRPHGWTPHVTLARRVPAGSMGTAVVAAHRSEGDSIGSATGMRRWDGTAKREWRLV
ncbi:2'-5' RNA ligase family protein [Rhodococcus artemisiae]|uniref:2'-5' RNA ligase family protein n=1 Tax=Rhodococcus artemisiae TaxID=714159 RepID=A0ABU7LEQ7_9NOCA|nr:2'-5' RNA ligase family protein [Rhodococcus artemisiae]MEE2060023.1 2'-5' RNA ligase family protein [Rhodococcus artemisiae]